MVRIAERLLYPLSDTSRRRKQAYRHLGTATQSIPERTQKSHLESKLNSYLATIDKQAQERLETLIEQMKQAQEITEQLKVENALKWIGRMNNIRACAREIVNIEIIYT